MSVIITESELRQIRETARLTLNTATFSTAESMRLARENAANAFCLLVRVQELESQLKDNSEGVLMKERIRDWIEYRFVATIDRLGDFRQSVRQRICSHRFSAEQKEMRYELDGKVSWTALYRCSNCEEILSVEASYWGEEERLREALRGEDAGQD